MIRVTFKIRWVAPGDGCIHGSEVRSFDVEAPEIEGYLAGKHVYDGVEFVGIEVLNATFTAGHKETTQ